MQCEEREYQSFRITVRAFELNNDVEIRRRTIDLARKEHREWLTSFYCWALNNKKVVELINPRDDDE
jgi:hypothetical protein